MFERGWTLVVKNLVGGFEATRGQMLVQNGRALSSLRPLRDLSGLTRMALILACPRYQPLTPWGAHIRQFPGVPSTTTCVLGVLKGLH